MNGETTMNKLLAIAAPAALMAGGLAAVVAVAGPAGTDSRAASGKTVKIEDARLKFEINATDRDGGVQLFLDAEQWRRMTLFDTQGREILTTTTNGVMAEQGGTELFLESAEPTFDDLSLEQLLARWPAGRYDVRGTGLGGETYVGTARLTHDLPAGPELLSPTEGAGPQDPAATLLRWSRVEPRLLNDIIVYQVLVVEPDTGIRALPKVTLDVMMPPTADRFAIPPGFLQPRTEYEWEVLAIEQGGNQTLSSSVFTTAG